MVLAFAGMVMPQGSFCLVTPLVKECSCTFSTLFCPQGKSAKTWSYSLRVLERLWYPNYNFCQEPLCREEGHTAQLYTVARSVFFLYFCCWILWSGNHTPGSRRVAWIRQYVLGSVDMWCVFCGGIFCCSVFLQGWEQTCFLLAYFGRFP